MSFDNPVDSSNINLNHWIEIAEIIELYYESHDGFVVLHGSDTMSYSSSALSFMLDNLNKPVIFTGSQLPIGDLRTDAKENLITFVTISTLGDAADFGDLTAAKGALPGASSSTRGLTFGGNSPSGFVNNIDLITIPTLGNATDFGDLLAVNAESTAASSQIRALCAGGESPSGSTWTNIIQYVTIATAGNAVDFGDLTVARGNDPAGFSDAHGGLAQ